MKYLFLVALALTGCGTTASFSKAPTFYVYGDSIAHGAVHPSYGDNIAVQTGLYESNRAVSGSGMFSANQYPQIMADGQNGVWGPNDALIFTPGHNDVKDSILADNLAYMAVYTQDLTDIVNLIHKVGVRAYIGTPLEDCNDTININPILDAYAQIARDAVTQINDPNIILIDFNKGVTLTPASTIDCMHPNVLGYQDMTNFFFSVVQH